MKIYTLQDSENLETNLYRKQEDNKHFSEVINF